MLILLVFWKVCSTVSCIRRAQLLPGMDVIHLVMGMPSFLFSVHFVNRIENQFFGIMGLPKFFNRINYSLFSNFRSELIIRQKTNFAAFRFI